MEDIHVMPVKDIRDHEESAFCWCKPVFESGGWDNADLYIHNGPQDRVGVNNYPCGHPRTEANTKLHGNGKACRICRQVIERRAQAKRRNKPDSKES